MAVPLHVGSPFQEASKISASDTCFSLQPVLRKRHEIRLTFNKETSLIHNILSTDKLIFFFDW